MKKQYMTPSLEIVDVKTTGMLANSLPKNEEPVTSESEVLSRRRRRRYEDEWDDEEEEW